MKVHLSLASLATLEAFWKHSHLHSTWSWKWKSESSMVKAKVSWQKSFAKKPSGSTHTHVHTHGQSQGFFAKRPFPKRDFANRSSGKRRMVTLDYSDFYSDEHFESSLIFLEAGYTRHSTTTHPNITISLPYTHSLSLTNSS